MGKKYIYDENNRFRGTIKDEEEIQEERELAIEGVARFFSFLGTAGGKLAIGLFCSLGGAIGLFEYGSKTGPAILLIIGLLLLFVGAAQAAQEVARESRLDRRRRKASSREARQNRKRKEASSNEQAPKPVSRPTKAAENTPSIKQNPKPLRILVCPKCQAEQEDDPGLTKQHCDQCTALIKLVPKEK